MRRICVACVVLVCPGSALAGAGQRAAVDPLTGVDADKKAGGQVTLSTTVVPGTVSRAVEVPTLTGPVPVGGEADPSLRVGLGGAVWALLGEDTVGTASWGLFRTQEVCDTCAGGEGPGWLGSELVRSTDLTVRVAHTVPLGEDVRLRLDGGAVLPASRAALTCNPFYGAPGAGATFDLPAGASSVQLGVSARRPIYRFDAAPVGLCAPALRGGVTVDTLSGPVEPTPWQGEWFAAANPVLTGAATVRWSDPHALFAEVPSLWTAVSTGLEYARAPAHAATTVNTLSGPVEVPPGSNPVRTVVPWSVEAGWQFGTRFIGSLSVSNRVPTLLADPGGTFGALPATTAFSLAVGARL